MAKPDQTQINLAKTTDANGWTVYDYGTWKQYAITKRIAGVASAAVGNTGSFNLPAGKTRNQLNIAFGLSIVTGAEGFTVGCNIDPTNSTATAINVFVKNNGTANPSSTVYVTITAIDA